MDCLQSHDFSHRHATFAFSKKTHDSYIIEEIVSNPMISTITMPLLHLPHLSYTMHYINLLLFHSQRGTEDKPPPLKKSILLSLSHKTLGKKRSQYCYSYLLHRRKVEHGLELVVYFFFYAITLYTKKKTCEDFWYVIFVTIKII